MAAQPPQETLKDRVARVLAAEVGPALAMDGTGFEVVDVSDGVVRLRLNGTCGSCPSTIMAVIMGIEHELRQRIPEAECLELVV